MAYQPTRLDFSALAGIGDSIGRGLANRRQESEDTALAADLSRMMQNGGPTDYNALTQTLLKHGKPVEALRFMTVNQPEPMSQYQQEDIAIKKNREGRQAREEDFTRSKIINRSKMVLDKVERMGKYAADTANHPGLERSTGGLKLQGIPSPIRDFVSSIVPAQSVHSLPQSPQADFEARIATLKGKVAFGELQAMREASETGGALGQVAVRELDLLMNSIESLDLNQHPDTLRKNLQNIAEQYKIATQAFKDAIAEQEGMRSVGGGRSGGLPSPGDVVDGYAYRSGDPRDPDSWELVQ